MQFISDLLSTQRLYFLILITTITTPTIFFNGLFSSCSIRFRPDPFLLQTTPSICSLSTLYTLQSVSPSISNNNGHCHCHAYTNGRRSTCNQSFLRRTPQLSLHQRLLLISSSLLAPAPLPQLRHSTGLLVTVTAPDPLLLVWLGRTWCIPKDFTEAGHRSVFRLPQSLLESRLIVCQDWEEMIVIL